jgi:hypothetical protein
MIERKLIEKTIIELNEKELESLSYDTVIREKELKQLNKGKLYTKEKYDINYLVGDKDYLYYYKFTLSHSLKFIKKDGDLIKKGDLIIVIHFDSKSLFYYYADKEGIFRKFFFTRPSDSPSMSLLFTIQIKEQEEVIEINEPCYLYLMEDLTNNLNKIGISNSPQYREKTLQSEKPQIVIVAAKQYPSRRIAASIEKALHELYKEKRIRGEWFNLSDNERIEIIKTLRE